MLRQQSELFSILNVGVSMNNQFCLCLVVIVSPIVARGGEYMLVEIDIADCKSSQCRCNSSLCVRVFARNTRTTGL